MNKQIETIEKECACGCGQKRIVRINSAWRFIQGHNWKNHSGRSHSEETKI